MPQPVKVKLLDMVAGLSMAMDLVSPVVVDHHARVGWVAALLAGRLGLSEEEKADLLLAGLLHDAGALSLASRLDALEFDSRDTSHAEAGYRLLRQSTRLGRIADLVRRHHTHISTMDKRGLAPRISNVLSVADRMDVLIRRSEPLPPQAKGIRKRMAKVQASVLAPEYVEAFMDLSRDREFWRLAEEPGRRLVGAAPAGLAQDMLDLDGILEFSDLFSQIIDFRSRFTSTHSRGVAEIAVALSERMDFMELEIKLMRVAGNLHDLGKLAVPPELLEKPGPLSVEEFARVKQHALHSDRILGVMPGLEQVRGWASHHHERMDGRGYPFQRTEHGLSLGSRIMAVADVFTAITEDRPYRKGMGREEASRVLQSLADEQALDMNVVRVLFRHFDEINEIRRTAQENARAQFETFLTATEET